MGIKRDRAQKAQVQGVRSAVTKAVRCHYRRLLQPLRVESMWHWRTLALSLLDASVPCQSGTLPVERYWQHLHETLPAQARCLTLPWFMVLSRIAFLRHTYRHCNASYLPAWTRGDSLLSERIDALAASACGFEREEAAQVIFEQFASEMEQLEPEHMG